MERKKEIQERLKVIANELKTLAEPNEELTEEQQLSIDDQVATLEDEGADLEQELATLISEEKRRSVLNRAAELETSAKVSSRVTSPNRLPTKITRQRLAIEDDPNRGFRSIAEFVQRISDCGSDGACRKDESLMHIAAGTGLQQSVNDYGGVLVPPGFSKAIWDDVMRQSNSLLDMCSQMALDPGNDSITVPAIAESSRANGSRWGGIQAYWKGEQNQMTESRPKLREVTLKPHELYVFSYISDKLLRNAPTAASQLINRASTDEIAFKCGDAVINGTGSGMPLGIVGHAATVSVSKETGQAAATILRENVNKMYSRMHSRWLDGAVWLVNQECIPALEDQKFDVGTSGIPVYIPPGGQADAPYARLKGKPVIPIEYCAALGTAGDIIFCNLRAYATAIRGMTDSSYSMHLKFDYNQTAFRMIFEMDGQPMLNSPITAYKGNNTYSPVITLATRS